MIPKIFTTPSGKTWDRSKPVRIPDAGVERGYLTGKHHENGDTNQIYLEYSHTYNGYQLLWWAKEDTIHQDSLPIDHPSHYGGDNTYEAIKVIEAWDLGFCLGNVVKYISRAGKKGDRLEDLKKAKWYLEREIATLSP